MEITKDKIISLINEVVVATLESVGIDYDLTSEEPEQEIRQQKGLFVVKYWLSL